MYFVYDLCCVIYFYVLYIVVFVRDFAVLLICIFLLCILYLYVLFTLYLYSFIVPMIWKYEGWAVNAARIPENHFFVVFILFMLCNFVLSFLHRTHTNAISRGHSICVIPELLHVKFAERARKT